MTSFTRSSRKKLAGPRPVSVSTLLDIDAPAQTPSEEAWRKICTAELLETDNQYFELATRSVDLGGARLVWSPGRTSIPLGCVILRVEEPKTPTQALEWLARFEEAIMRVDSRFARIYLQKPNPVLESVLTGAGYEKRPEVVFVAPTIAPPTDTAVMLRLLRTEADLDKMAKIQAEGTVGPDGHVAADETWNELVRQKWRTGELSLYFIENRDGICGSVGAMNDVHILRLKNLVVRPSHRKKGVGRGATIALWKRACGSGKRLGTFGVPGGGGYATYKSAGLEPTSTQYEWCRKLIV